MYNSRFDKSCEKRSKLHNADAVIEKLTKDAVSWGTYGQTDVYLAQTPEELRNSPKWLSVRQTERKDKDEVSCSELRFADCEKNILRVMPLSPKYVGALSSILYSLGYVETVVVSKQRQIFIFEDFVIHIDDVAHLGTFIEISCKGMTDLDFKRTCQRIGAEVSDDDAYNDLYATQVIRWADSMQ